MIEGRDIGTVVFPDADAEAVRDGVRPRVRAARRVAELGGDVDEVASSIAERDRRGHGAGRPPLARRRGAAVVDTSDLTVDEVVRANHRAACRDRAVTNVETFLAEPGVSRAG